MILRTLLPPISRPPGRCTSRFWREVKYGTAALDTTDRQNAHSMTIAVKGHVELFKFLNHQKELHREILAFSISQDHQTMRIYGHYSIIVGNKTIFYRHPIREFSFTELDGKEKWAAYKFTKNAYDIWMPALIIHNRKSGRYNAVSSWVMSNRL